jgi:hypothetical protein
MDQSQQPENWARLWATVRPHEVEPGELGEYAAVLLERGGRAAERAFPGVAAHLGAACDRCTEDLAAIHEVLRQEQRAAPIVPPPKPVIAWTAEGPGRQAPDSWKYALGVAAAAAFAIPSAMAASLPGSTLLLHGLVLASLLASLAVVLVVSNTWALQPLPPVPGVVGSRLAGSRRRFLVGAAAAWLLGTAAVYTVPSTAGEPVLVLAEPALRPWVNEVIERDPSLRAMNWRIVGPDEAGRHPSDGLIWLALDRSPALQGRQAVPVARSVYVVAAWEPGLESLGLRVMAPVDWHRLQTAVASPDGARFALPLPGTPLGDDGLLLLALAHQGSTSTTLAQVPPAPEALVWLTPFFSRQARPRTDERIQIEDWWRYRAGVGDVGLLPEHDALELMMRLPAAPRLQVRYPAVNLTRSYLLASPTDREAGRAAERLRSALLGADAQAALWTSGFRPVSSTGPPGAGYFLTLESRGVDWRASWLEAIRPEGFERWAATWRP